MIHFKVDLLELGSDVIQEPKYYEVRCVSYECTASKNAGRLLVRKCLSKDAPKRCPVCKQWQFINLIHYTKFRKDIDEQKKCLD